MKKPYPLLFFVVLLACASPQKSLQDGNYNKAFKASLNDMKKKNSDSDSKEILSSALTKMIEKEKENLEIIKLTNSIDSKKLALKNITKLQKKVNQAIPFTGDKFILVSEELTNDEEYFNFQLSDIYVQKGIAELVIYHETKQKAKAKKAYECFEKSKKYVPLTLELDSLSKNSLELAQVIYLIEVPTLRNTFHSREIKNKFDDLTSNDDRFRKIYFDTFDNVKNVDCKIEISLSSLDIDTEKSENSEEFKTDITTTETTTNSDGEEVEVESTTEVVAKVFTKEITKTAEWEVRISVAGTKNCNVSDTRFTEDYSSNIVEMRYEGDERALPSKYKSGSDGDLMSDNGMMKALLDKVYDEVEHHIF